MNSSIRLNAARSAMVAFSSFAVLAIAQAAIPAPDGGYPGGNTAEGQAALFSLTTSKFNTGLGFLSLTSNTESSFNTTVGAGALLFNTAFNPPFPVAKAVSFFRADNETLSVVGMRVSNPHRSPVRINRPDRRLSHYGKASTDKESVVLR